MRNLLLILFFGGSMYVSFIYSNSVAPSYSVKILSAKTGPQEDFKITQKDVYELVDKTFALENPRIRLQAQQVAACESNWHYTSKNSHSTATGVYQFLESSWIGYRKLMKRNTDPLLRYNPVENIETAYFAFKRSGWQPWLASKNCWN